MFLQLVTSNARVREEPIVDNGNESGTDEK